MNARQERYVAVGEWVSTPAPVISKRTPRRRHDDLDLRKVVIFVALVMVSLVVIFGHN